jgi:hypothetical protein
VQALMSPQSPFIPVMSVPSTGGAGSIQKPRLGLELDVLEVFLKQAVAVEKASSSKCDAIPAKHHLQ